MFVNVNYHKFERNVYKYLVIKLAPMDLSTALHKKCWKGALLFTFLAQKKRINILYCVLVQI